MWGGSLIGGIEETQKMLDFCSEHNVTPLTETVAMDYVNTAMERLHKVGSKGGGVEGREGGSDGDLHFFP